MMWPMEKWITSDLHIGHHNIITYCNRPFADVEDMNECLVALWNDTIKPTDKVLVLGDVFMGHAADSFKVAKRLNGVKTLLIGNHDRMFGKNGVKYANEIARYAEVFEVIREGTMRVDLGRGRSSILACHFPYADPFYDERGYEDRYESHRPVNSGEWLIHGHTHGQWLRKGRQIDVGIDAWGGIIPQADDITAIMDQSDGDLRPLEWMT